MVTFPGCEEGERLTPRRVSQNLFFSSSFFQLNRFYFLFFFKDQPVRKEYEVVSRPRLPILLNGKWNTR